MKQKTNKTIGIALFAIVLTSMLFSISLINAYDEDDSLWDQLYSAIGRNANCDVTPCKNDVFSGAKTVSCCSSGGEYPGSSDCLIGVYHANYEGTSSAFECGTYPGSEYNNCLEYIVTGGSQSINSLTANSIYEIYNCPEGSLTDSGGDPSDCDCDFSAPKDTCTSSNTCGVSKPICKEQSGDDVCITSAQYGDQCPNGLDGSSASCECDHDYSDNDWKNQRCTPSKPYCLDKAGSSYDYCSATSSGSAPNNWVYSATECISPKPYGCYDSAKTCATSESSCPSTVSCSDGIQNQGETGVDCGGPCSACGKSEGADCSQDSECQSGFCNNGAWYNPVNWFTSGKCESRTVIANGTKAVGQACTNDAECETLHCDDEGWFQVANVCQLTPWDEAKRVAQTKENINKMTNQELLTIACTETPNCLSPSSEYKATCINMKKLQDEGTITVSSSGFFDNAISVIEGGAVGGIVGGTVGLIGTAALCLGGVAATIALVPTVAGSAAAATAASYGCYALTVAGASAGVVIGTAQGLRGQISADDDNEIVKQLKAKSVDNVGFCVAEPISGGMAWAQKFAWFDLNGNGTKDSTDGLIILGIIIILGVIILLK